MTYGFCLTANDLEQSSACCHALLSN